MLVIEKTIKTRHQITNFFMSKKYKKTGKQIYINIYLKFVKKFSKKIKKVLKKVLTKKNKHSIMGKVR